jgi:hypothetical protein
MQIQNRGRRPPSLQHVVETLRARVRFKRLECKLIHNDPNPAILLLLSGRLAYGRFSRCSMVDSRRSTHSSRSLHQQQTLNEPFDGPSANGMRRLRCSPGCWGTLDDLSVLHWKRSARFGRGA